MMWNKEITLEYNNLYTTIPQYIKSYMRIVGIYVHNTYLELEEDSKWPVVDIDGQKYEIKGDNKEELIKIIRFIKSLNLISTQEEKTLYEIADIYDDNDVLNMLLSTRYNAPNEELFKKMSRKLEKIFDLMYWDESEYMNYALLYIAFECNCPMKRIKDAFVFDHKWLLEELRKFPDTAARNLLIAQIYDDLCDKKEKAKDFYISVKNEFSWYKLGLIYHRKDRNYETARWCFEKALALNPYNMKAIMNLAYIKEKYYAAPEEAVKIFKKVIDLPITNDYKRVVEIEYKRASYVNNFSLWEITLGSHTMGYEYVSGLFAYLDSIKEKLDDSSKYDLIVKEYLENLNLDSCYKFYNQYKEMGYGKDEMRLVKR